MAVLGVSKGASTDDDDGRVATWWRPAEPCTCRSFAAAWTAGGPSGAARQEAACGTLELRDERRSNVAMASSPGGCDGLEAETRSALRVPACVPGPAPAIWATQVAYVVHPGCLTAVTSASECHPAIRTGWGGSHIGRGAVTHDQHIFSYGFLCCTIHNRSPPDHGPLTIMCHRLRKRWDENTSSSKGPHKVTELETKNFGPVYRSPDKGSPYWFRIMRS